jgi:hypothetical protein
VTTAGAIIELLSEAVTCGHCKSEIPVGTPIDDGNPPRPICPSCGERYVMTKLARLRDAGLLAAGEEEAKLPPMELIARVFERPIADLEKRIDFDRVLPEPAPGTSAQLKKKSEIDIRGYRLAIVNKVSPEMLLAIVGTLIATSATAAEAVGRIRAEVMGWRFQREDGTLE